MSTPADIADAVVAFFARHGVASMKLPSGWFGRPFDNQHQLTAAVPVGDRVSITLDETRTLHVAASAVVRERRVLTIAIEGGEWQWTSYGGADRHVERLPSGVVEFHAVPGR